MKENWIDDFSHQTLSTNIIKNEINGSIDNGAFSLLYLKIMYNPAPNTHKELFREHAENTR